MFCIENKGLINRLLGKLLISWFESAMVAGPEERVVRFLSTIYPCARKNLTVEVPS